MTNTCAAVTNNIQEQNKIVENVRKACPLEDLSNNVKERSIASCPFHKRIHKRAEETSIKKDVPFRSVSDGSFRSSGTSVAILRDVGGSDLIRQMCTRFYARAFLDVTLSKFMFETDGAAAHGKRLADWIVEKMGGEGEPWSDSGRRDMRQVSHSKAWHSKKRDEKDRGKRFKLDDCRIWMRLMFWAGREVGLAENQTFWKWYVGFIGHFIGIYEMSAPAYAKESATWSEEEANLKKYAENGNAMLDVIGIGRW